MMPISTIATNTLVRYLVLLVWLDCAYQALEKLPPGSGDDRVRTAQADPIYASLRRMRRYKWN